MYRRLNIFLIIGAVFTIITGTLLHFVYEWSGESLFVGIFSPINESVWEHLKLLFFPMSVWILIGYFIFGKKFKTYIPSAVIGILSGMICGFTLILCLPANRFFFLIFYLLLSVFVLPFL